MFANPGELPPGLTDGDAILAEVTGILALAVRGDCRVAWAADDDADVIDGNTRAFVFPFESNGEATPPGVKLLPWSSVSPLVALPLVVSTSLSVSSCGRTMRRGSGLL